MEARAATLGRLGQSIWYDNISRDLLDSGELARLTDREGVRGVTSNPTIFQKAMSSSKAYGAQFASLAARNLGTEAIYEAMAVDDIRRGADILRGVFDRSGGADGFISLEVSPRLARDTEGTVTEAHRLAAAVGRPNLMIKVPATPEGIPAIRRLVADGLSVNVTLIFSLAAYASVIEAYLAGLEDRAKAGKPVTGIASVASFFVSRVDTAIDGLLEAKAKADPARAAEFLALRGKAAIANAQLAYRLFEKEFGGPRFAALAAKGARVQRPLWASTSTKNPSYKDTIYVDALIGAHTVNTVPPATLTALNDHGATRLTIHEGMDGAEGVLTALAGAGISLAAVCDELLAAGVKSFAQSFDELLAAVDARRKEVPPAEGGPFRGQRLAESLSATLEGLQRRGVLRRLWARDPSVLTTHPAGRASVATRLGWLDAHAWMLGRLPEIRAFADGVRADGYIDCVLLGMGGSSLCAEVLAETCGGRPGWLRLTVLDTTDPEAIRTLESTLDLSRTLFLVASKSGSTIETDCLARHFLARYAARRIAEPGRHFVAITDPGSALGRIAEEGGWRAVFENPPEIGGRYSATSLFGVVPAALMGIDLVALLASAAREAEANGPSVSPDAAPAVRLGALLGAAANAGCDKLVLRSSPGLASFGAWAEQLIAESTGKDGRGILPVTDEPAGSHAGDDRIYVDLVLGHESGPSPLAPAAHDRIEVDRATDLGALFFRFELATAIAGAVIGVQPFDEPNVAEAKAATAAVLDGKGAAPDVVVAAGTAYTVRVPRAVAERFGTGAPLSPASALAGLLGLSTAGDYVALLAYVARTPNRAVLLQKLRAAASRRARASATLGFGPRYLHSTGQLHKGGAANGIFLVITRDDDVPEIPVPGKPFGFGKLFAAQAEGDVRTLAARGRRVAEIRLHGDPDAALAEIASSL